MDLADVMDQVAARLDTIEGLRVHAHPPGRVVPPAAVVSYPDTLEFDATYGRGMDRMTLPVVLVVGRAVDRAARDELAAYCNGAGQRSIKGVLESGAYTAFDTIRVQDIDFDVVTIAAIDYIAALLTLDIGGQGDPTS
jgi:hypothetical protein